MSDKDILLAAIKENPQWGEKLNWKAEIDDLEYFTGVEVDTETGKTVTALFLSGFGLSGEIPGALNGLKGCKT